MKELYLDAAASAPLYPQVISDMKKSFNSYGNPSSSHTLGREARKAIEQARTIFCREIQAKPWEIYFTSGVTESNNWMLQGLAQSHPEKKKVIISSIEHASIREPCELLHKKGYSIEVVPVNREGIINIEVLEKMIDSKTLVVSIMHVNNILGSIQPIEQIGALCKKKKVFFHTDSAQGFGKLKIDVRGYNIDMLSASGHKIGGPRGIGFLYIKEGIAITPLLSGGGQERGGRAGTENSSSIIGFSSALKEHKRQYLLSKLNAKRAYFVQQLMALGANVTEPSSNVPHIIHASFSGKDAQFLVEYLSNHHVYASVGSACDSKRAHEDHVLRAIGLDLPTIRGSMRFSFLPTLSRKDIDLVCRLLEKCLKIKS